MLTLRSENIDHLDGDITLPGDKSISHRALIFGALAAATEEGVVSPHLMLLGAMLALLMAMAPLVAAAALKIGENESGI